jgi:hypothetical protein
VPRDQWLADQRHPPVHRGVLSLSGLIVCMLEIVYVALAAAFPPGVSVRYVYTCDRL